MLCFWQTGRDADWRANLVTVIAAVMTKGNGLLLVVTSFVILLFKTGIVFWKKIWRLLLASFALFVSCGWYYFWRMVLDQKPELCGNFTPFPDPYASMNYVFDPIRILNSPFNDIAWSIQDPAVRPQNFWEFLFRSAFFGEWMFPFKIIGALTEGLAMVLLIYAAYGIYVDFRKKEIFWPGFVTLFVQVISLWLYRVRLGAGSSMNNFRYIPIIVVPILYYLILGVRSCPGWVRSVGIACMTVFGICCLCDVVLVSNSS
jgi:hypothetical protein